MPKVSIEFELNDEKHIAAVVAIVRLFELFDKGYDAAPDDIYEIVADHVDTPSGRKYWNVNLPAALGEVIDAYWYLVMDNVDLEDDSLVAELFDTFFDEAWESTARSLKIIAEKVPKYIEASKAIRQARQEKRASTANGANE